METLTMPEVMPATPVAGKDDARYSRLHAFATAALKLSSEGNLSKRVLAIFKPSEKEAKVLVDGSMLMSDFFAITDMASFTNNDKRRIIFEVQFATEAEIALESYTNGVIDNVETVGVNYPLVTVINC